MRKQQNGVTSGAIVELGCDIIASSQQFRPEISSLFSQLVGGTD